MGHPESAFAFGNGNNNNNNNSEYGDEESAAEYYEDAPRPHSNRSFASSHPSHHSCSSHHQEHTVAQALSCSRICVVLVLLVAASAVGSVAFVSLTRSEEVSFQNEVSSMCYI
jgi:hypothetical protein